jgi:deazaflavin-dependent oxidoreductase (nitroreductase family)
MAKQYNLGVAERSANALFGGLARLGMGARYRHILTVRGRKTGTLHSTPVDVMDVGGARWLVAPYGVVGWVRNARAAGVVELARGGKKEQFGVEEVGADEAVPVIREYIRDVPVTKSYWDCGSDGTDADLAAQVPGHPVFRLVALPT